MHACSNSDDDSRRQEGKGDDGTEQGFPSAGFHGFLRIGGAFRSKLEEGAKQPYYITPIDGEPLFFAGLSGVRHGAVPREDKGFVIVTDAAGEGMLDVHDRRPLVLNAEAAEGWLDPSTTFEEATHLANNAGRHVEAFRWFAVSKGVNKAGNDDPAFNEPLGGPDSAPGASA